MSTKAYREAVEYALGLGLIDDGIDGAGHHRFTSPVTGLFLSVSTTMKSGRSLANAKASLRRCAGKDSRGAVAHEGERKGRRRLGRLASGFRLDEAIREARSRPTTPRAPTRDDLVAEREAAYMELLEMRERDGRAERLAARVIELDGRIAAL